MKFNTKPKCIYIKNIYIQPTKYQKIGNSANVFMENKKLNDFNDNNNNQISKKNSNQITKASIKTLYHNIFPQKQNNLISGNAYYFSSKDIKYKSTNHKEKDITMPIMNNKGSVISGRKLDQKNYEIVHPFKERSNSENSINCFTRTYSFFNKENKKDKVDKKEVGKEIISNITYIYNNKTNISCANIHKKKYNLRNNPNNDGLITYTSKNSSCSCTISRKNSKKYFYQDQTVKKNNKNDRNINNNRPTVFYSAFQKDQFQIQKMFDCNMSSTTIPNNNTDQINLSRINHKNAKRIQKYILSDKKRKMKSRQNYHEQKNPLSKSTSMEKNYNIYCSKYTPIRNNKENQLFKNKSPLINTPSIIINDNLFNNFKDFYNCSHLKENKKISFKDINNNYENILDTSNYCDSNSIYDNYYKDYNQKKIEGMKIKVFEQSALIIQSVFRGFLVRNKLDTFLFNYKNYSKAIELIEKIFYSYSNIEKEKLIKYLKEITQKNKNLYENKNNINIKSCKSFKLNKLPYTFNEYLNTYNKSKFMDRFLHEEIGERFNIITQSKNKEKELEKKHKEELENLNNKLNEIIEENNILKDINEKGKKRENKFKELSMENKKKDNIINIITNDNQNLAKKLKIIKDKYNKLYIEKQTSINFQFENNKSKYKSQKEILEDYKKIYLLYLINKKNARMSDNLQKNFDKYRNIITTIKNDEQLKLSLKECNLNHIIINQKNKIKIITYISLIKLYYNDIIKQKEIQNRNNLIKEKLSHLIRNKEKNYQNFIKSNFKKFYYNGIISYLIEEKNKNMQKEKTKKLNNLQKAIISVENRTNNYIIIKHKNSFNKWNLLSKILSMKAITDEKKRKKRQKQRTKKKLEKNKSANKYLSNSTSMFNIHSEKNNINVFKEKDKEINYLEHSVTTEFSGMEISIDNRTDKIMRATDKLKGIFYKAALFYKLLENKNNNNKDGNTDNINNRNIGKNNNEKQNVKDDNRNDDEDDEDSGESSFGI
jgi:hypothetical protein